MGIILYQLLFQKFPFTGSSREELKYRICNSILKIPEFYNEEEKELLSLMLNKNEEYRISIEEIQEYCKQFNR